MGSFNSAGFTNLQSQITVIDNSISDEIVVVKSVSDLPAPTMVGGVNTIVLGNKEYLFDGPISSANPLGWPGAGNTATIRAVNRAIWTYTGTDSCFRDTDAEGNVEIHGLTEFQAPTGDMWDVTASTGGWSFQAGGPAVKFTNCNSLGTLDGGASGNGGFNVFFGTMSDFDQGLTATDLFFFEINTMFLFGNNVAGCTYFTSTGANTSGSVNMYTNTFNNGTNETMWDFTSNIETGVDSINLRGNVQEGGINGSVLKAGSLDLDTPKFFSEGNTVIANSRPKTVLSLTGNTSATVIAAADTPVKVVGTWVVEQESQFTSDTTGKMTYNGINNLDAPLIFNVSSIISGGGQSDTATYYVAKNGSIIAAAKSIATHDTTDPVNTVLIWQEILVTGDFIELYVENNDDTSDIEVQDGVMITN